MQGQYLLDRYISISILRWHKVKRLVSSHTYLLTPQYKLVVSILYHFLLPKALSIKGPPIKATLPERHFNPNSEAALQSMLSDWQRIQWNTVGRCEKRGYDAMKHHSILP